MSIASAIATKQQQVADCYTVVSNKGGTLPVNQNLTNLADAIDSITTEGDEYPGLDVRCYISELTPYFEIPSGAYKDYTVNYNSYKCSGGNVGKVYLTGKPASGIFSPALTNIGCNMTADGIVSGFYRGSNNNYKGVLVNDTFPSTITQFEFIIKAYTDNPTATSYHNVLFADNATEKYFAVRGGGYGKFSLYDGSWTNGSTSIQANTWYWYRVIFDGTTLTGYILEDNDYNIDSLPDLSNWSQEWSKNSNILANKQFIFGCNRYSNNEYWHKDIDFSQTKIVVNNDTVYSYNSNIGCAATTAEGVLKSGLTDQSTETEYNVYFYNGAYEFDTSKQDNHFGGTVIVPTHTVHTAFPPIYTINGFINYIASTGNGYGFSNFTNIDYIKSSTNFSIPATSWTSQADIYIHFKTPKTLENKTDCVMLFHDLTGGTTGSEYTWNRGILLLFGDSGNKVWFCLGHNGTRYCAFNSSDLSLDTEYWLRVSFTSSGVTMSVSTDNTTWSQVGSSTYSSGMPDIIGEKDIYVGNAFINGSDDKSFQKSGIIYPSGTYIKIGNNQWQLEDINIQNS